MHLLSAFIRHKQLPLTLVSLNLTLGVSSKQEITILPTKSNQLFCEHNVRVNFYILNCGVIIPISGFLNLGTIDILDQMVLSCEDCPEHCGILAASLASIHQLPVGHTSLVTTTKTVSRLPNVLWGKIMLSWKP